MKQWSRLTGQSIEKILRTSAKMTISNPRQGSGLLQITPPSGGGMFGTMGKRQGEAAIDRDLAAVFIPVQLKHQRRERWPNVAEIHSARFRSGSRFGKKLTRGRAQAYYVDVVKLRALRRQLFARVGKLAAGWVPAARALGAAVPAWIARHGTARGTISMRFSAPRYSIEMVCLAAANSPHEEMQFKNVPYAIRYATNNLTRQIAHRLGSDARTAGFAA
ncbi:MAG TPA: hypothetical protein VLH79_06865 [Chthonomonadales bacterium]|nr:hypothetical protein [Chthonomonadales bacterium]